MITDIKKKMEQSNLSALVARAGIAEQNVQDALLYRNVTAYYNHSNDLAALRDQISKITNVPWIDPNQLSLF